MVGSVKEEGRTSRIEFTWLIVVSKSALDQKVLKAVRSLNKGWCMRPPLRWQADQLRGAEQQHQRCTERKQRHKKGCIP